ncbi:hypothetical protein C8J56DRAFT_769392 [Mycena floridula]|nr:hypothetical protein C8J56DRAFT_769392 [Mycena floridula]
MYSDYGTIQTPAVKPPEALRCEETVHAWIEGTTINEKYDDAKAACGIYIENLPHKSKAIRLPKDLPQNRHSGRLTATLMSIQMTRTTTPLEIHVPSKAFATTLAKKLETWEDIGFVGMQHRKLLQAIAARLRARTAETTLVIHEGSNYMESNREAVTLADEGLNKRAADQVDWSVREKFQRPGVKLECLTQSIAYKAITEMKSIPETKVWAKTKQNIDSIKIALTLTNGHPPTNKDIWKSIRGEAINRRAKNFMYLMVHGAQRVGAYWKHIPGCEDRQLCKKCGTEESMEHILTQCQMPIQNTIWKLAQELLDLKGGVWPQINYGLMMGHGLVKIKSSPKTIDKGRTRLFYLIMSESIHQIWKLRCDVVVDEEEIPTERHIENAWTAALNTRLEEDRLLTNKFKYKKKALQKDIVLETWKGTLKDENLLPVDWIRHPEVLVGIGQNNTPPAADDEDCDSEIEDSFSSFDFG